MTNSPNTITDFYARNETANTELNPRLELFLEQYRRQRARLERPLRILDIGCGRGMILSHHVDRADEYWGCDIVPAELVGSERFRTVDLNNASLRDSFEGRFDVIFCGEIVEHLFSPDALLDELRELMTPDARLLLSTPNLGYLLNRIMLLFGISPFFLENSSRQKLGRRTKWLGQGNETQGHIRLFTYQAMLDLLAIERLRLVESIGIPVWFNFAVDRAIARLSPRLAADVLYVVALDG